MIGEAADAARAADVAVVVVSDPASEGMDRSTLALPADQDKLISAVAAANPRTVVVLNTLQRGHDAVAGQGRRRSSRPGTRARRPAPRWPTCCSATSTRPASCR